MWILLEIFVIIIYILSVMFCYKFILKDLSLQMSNGDRLLAFVFSVIPIVNIICCLIIFISNYLEKRDKEGKNIFKFLSFLEPKEKEDK